MADQPYFSIGITTFDRRELLLEAVGSVLGQRFGDFEVLVGNDNPGRVLTAAEVGSSDPRVRIVNHPRNLGEVGNMNQLLALARGRYFTWLADDDLHAPEFLQAVRECHQRFEPLPCVFTGHVSGTVYRGGRVDYQGRMRACSGRKFLSDYLARRIRAIGCYGVYEVGYLRAAGGVEQLGSGFSPYSDNLLAIRAGLLDRLGYIDAPLLFFRTHPGSLSYSSSDVTAYITAQEALCARAIEVFRDVRLRGDLRHNLYHLLSYWCIEFFYAALRRIGSGGSGLPGHYDDFIRRYAQFLGPFRPRLAVRILYLRCKHWLASLRRRPAGAA